MTVIFDEAMDTSVKFPVDFPAESPSSLTYNPGSSEWTTATNYIARYDVANTSEVLGGVDLEVATACTDIAGNVQIPFNDADKFSIDMSTGIEDLASASLLTVYPNPVREGNLLSVELNGADEESRIEFYNTQGKLVQWELIGKLHQVIQINTNALPPGLYLLRAAGKNFDRSARVQIF
jgi:hypothetical protein